MAKISLKNTRGGYDLSSLNSNFQKLEQELQDKVLYRDNPDGEPNHVEQDIDLNGHRIFNTVSPIYPTDLVRLKDITSEDFEPGDVIINLNGIQPYTKAEAASRPDAELGQIVQLTDVNNQQFQYTLPEPNDGLETIEAPASGLTMKRLPTRTVTPQDYQIPFNNTTDYDINFQALVDNYDKIDLAGSTVTLFGTINLRESTKIYNGTIKQADTFVGDLKQTSYAGSGPYDNYPALYAENADDIKFTDVEFDGNNTGRAAPVGSSSSLVMLVNCSDAKFKDCDTHHNVADQATLQGGAIFLVGGDGHTYVGGTIHDIQDEGWHSRANYTTVRGTALTGSTSSLVGSQLYNGEEGNFGKGLVVIGCPEISGCPIGAAVSCNHEDSVISSNSFTNNKHAIIMGHRSSYARRSPANGSVASANVVKGTTSSAIQLQYGKDISVTGGTLRDVGTDGSLTASYAIQGTTWCAGGTISGVTINGAPGAVLLSKDISDVDETVTPNWVVSGVVANNIVGYGIRSDDCSGKVSIKGNTISEVNTGGVSSRAGVSVFTNYDNLNSPTPDTTVAGNDIGSPDNDCFRAVSVSVSNKPGAVVHHKVVNNISTNASLGYVSSPPSAVLEVDNYLDGVKV